MSILQGRVLELNAHYEPIGVITVMRAIVQIHKGKARTERLCDPLQFVHTTTDRYEVPSVIVQTTRYVNVRKKRRESGKQRFRIFVRDGFRCQYCAKKFQPAELTLDHIIPQSQAGPDDQENLATACISCNQRKANRTPDAARMPLLATPSALRYGLDRAMLAHYAETRPDWKPFLCLDTKERAA